MKMDGTGKDAKLFENDGRPIFFADEISEIAFLRNRYNNAVTDKRRIEAEAKLYGVTDRKGLDDFSRTLYKYAVNDIEVICKYISEHDIDYGEIDPETGLIVERKQNGK